MRSASLFVGAAVPELWSTNRRSKQLREETPAVNKWKGGGTRENATFQSHPTPSDLRI